MASGTHDRQQSDAAKARRELQALEEQSEKLVNPPGPEEIDPNDPAEKWGRILGRGLGYVVVIYLLYHLATTYLLNSSK